MKCKERLCQRSKNISLSGRCEVCENVIKEMNKKNETIKKQSNFEKVQLDFKVMVETHRKLLKGDQVEPKLVNTLLIGGVLNILNQSESMEDLEKIVKALEYKDVSNKAKIEYLENWVVKQNNVIEDLSEKLSRVDENGVFTKESKDVESLRKKIVSIEIDVSSMRRKTPTLSENPNQKKKIKCNECSETFNQTCQLEIHMEEKHETDKQFKCSICEKDFVLNWRLKKHMNIHSERPKVCRYYVNKEACPYERIGCMFQHGDDQTVNENASEVVNIEKETEKDEFAPQENQCHLCEIQMNNKDELYHHVEISHEDYFKGMLKVVASMSR